MATFHGGGARPPGMPSPAPTNKYGQGSPPGWKAPFGLVSGYPVAPDGTVHSWETWCVLYPHACPPDWMKKLKVPPPKPPPPVLPPSIFARFGPAKKKPVATAPAPRPAPTPTPPRRGPTTPRATPYVPPYVPPKPAAPPAPVSRPYVAPYQPPYIPPTRRPQPIPCGGGT